MKKFVFRLERVLQLRADAEQACARALSEAQQVEALYRQRQEESAARIDRLSEQLVQAPSRLLSAGLLCNLGLTLQAAHSELADAAKSLVEAREVADAERVRFTQARIERRVVEKLKEQRHATWHGEVERGEQKAIDEMALRAHLRRGTGT